jgi:DnaK suppressor protein
VATTAKKAAPKAQESAAKKPAAKAAPAPKKPAPVAKIAAAQPVAAKKAAPAPAPVAKVAAKPAAKPSAKTADKPAAKPAPQPATKTEPARKPAVAKAAPASKPAATPGVISEAELLKMSDKDYMNEAQLAFFKAKLMAMREEILSNARETGEHLKENEVFADPNDRATVEEENMLEQRVRDRERKLMKKINQSLARIESGEYGFCLETGEPIGIPRLLARPTAELSIEAQEKHERRERLYAD